MEKKKVKIMLSAAAVMTAAGEFHQRQYGHDCDYHHHRIPCNAGCQLDNLLCMESREEEENGGGQSGCA